MFRSGLYKARLFRAGMFSFSAPTIPLPVPEDGTWIRLPRDSEVWVRVPRDA